MSGSRIRVALFDLDDTLFAHRAAVDAAITRHRRELPGWSADDDTAEARRWTDLEEHHYHRYLAGELDFLGQRAARARDFAAPYGLVLDDPDDAETWFGRYFERYREAWRLHDDALVCLDALTRAGTAATGGAPAGAAPASPPLRIGIITNGELDFQTRKIEQVELTARVEHVVASGAFGATKPDASIFRHAVDLFGVEPHEAAYIGDRFRTDAVGAAHAGLLGVWLDRHDRATPAERAEAVARGIPIIPTLAPLPALLRPLH
ncbi:HAD family hydrolase [Schumannella sp. 10F1B-5-1]|uniref:HAD family hydrolase n=1 Tax=Schumannella sp. 10F1B-5-1 TaxID=2590780 RepID=UPI001131CE4B|nr:HAD family hydrolase [Schumannella sp. 10F1B-5-1]TPW73506.1 HAD family hydrolase [Schumannella sp. 10F1B-5-1]